MSDLTPEALDTIEAEDHAVNCAALDIDSHTIGFDPEKCDCYVVELRRLRTENEEQGRRIAAALLASRDSRYPASSFDIIVALTGEATE